MTFVGGHIMTGFAGAFHRNRGFATTAEVMSHKDQRFVRATRRAVDLAVRFILAFGTGHRSSSSRSGISRDGLLIQLLAQFGRSVDAIVTGRFELRVGDSDHARKATHPAA